MTCYFIALCSLTGLYALALIFLRKGFRKHECELSGEQPSVSIIVAARNEEKNIANCLTAILNQSYPKNRLEVIVVDDRSADRTAEIVENFAKSNRQARLLRIADRALNFAPKTRAIDLAIRNAGGDIIFTTDADCRPGPQWIAEMVKYFTPNVGMVAGYNPYQTTGSLFSKILALDYFAMACVAAASAGLNYPMSCSGGNLAYRRRLYFEIGGFQKHGRWISGDDDFFLQRVRESSKWKIRYAVDPKTFVPTAPPQTLREFVQQRIRYASKCAHYSAPVTIALAAAYVLNLLLVLGALGVFFQPVIFPAVGAACFIKSFSEYYFLDRGARWFQTRHSPLTFLAAAALHPLYIAAMGLLGRFSNFKWKGENYSAHTGNVRAQRTKLIDRLSKLRKTPTHA
jgi:cellulose synthase/poly-beta-1,6-N-acetylglucosamine synthase-like glycosyltransferase